MAFSIRSLACLLVFAALSPRARAGDVPDDALPSYVTRLTDYGERAEFSHDGRRVLYVTKTGGEVEEIDRVTRKVRRISNFDRPAGVGFYRAYYLANGDYLLTGGPKRDEASMYFVSKGLDKPPVVLDEIIAEGAAVSRKNMRLAWTPDAASIWIADIVYVDGKPTLKGRRLVVKNEEVQVPGSSDGYIEPQNLEPRRERTLVFTKYGRKPYRSETLTIDLRTGNIRNQSHTPDLTDEPEGIFPDGKHTTVERGTVGRTGGEIYRLRLDGSGRNLLRLTYISDIKPPEGRYAYKATNPAISDDGRFMAYQEGWIPDVAGAGHGILLMDLRKAMPVLKRRYDAEQRKLDRTVVKRARRPHAVNP